MAAAHPEVDDDPASRVEPTLRLGRRGLAWRSAVLLTGVTCAVLGTAVWDDRAWPFAPMSQFAFYVGPQSEIRSTYVDAVWTDGGQRPLQLTASGVGIGRAEIEGRLVPITKDPSLLQDLADRQALLHPDGPQPTVLWLRQRVTALVDGRPAGTTVETLATWTVQR